jgi:mono/diheme cytochrome c family protein
MKSDVDGHASRSWPEPGPAVVSAALVSTAPVSEFRRVATMGLISGAVLSLCGTAFAQDAAAVAAGENAWDKAGCLECHGASGQGGDGGEFPAGPSLQKTQLDRAALVETISCGLPGTQMPSWLDEAYTKRSCYGFPLGPAPAEVTATPVLSAGEIAALVDYLMAKIVGR